MSPEAKRLAGMLAKPGFAIAVSGGVDSMTLALFSSSLGLDFKVFHARSPAVPPAASERVRKFARLHGWQLTEINAAEFDDPQYLANPYNRCLHCKRNLYTEIRAHTDDRIFSGTNLDDLEDFRPGLQAAAHAGVQHPYVEARIDKLGVRQIARALGAPDLAELPASPCLSSRIETGIPIEGQVLTAVDQVETWLSGEMGFRGPRCRVRTNQIVIELAADSALSLSPSVQKAIVGRVREVFASLPADLSVSIEPYRRGSAFVAPSAPA